MNVMIMQKIQSLCNYMAKFGYEKVEATSNVYGVISTFKSKGNKFIYINCFDGCGTITILNDFDINGDTDFFITDKEGYQEEYDNDRFFQLSTIANTAALFELYECGINISTIIKLIEDIRNV